MNIDKREYLDYSDVLIIPRKTKLRSRNNVSIIRQFPANRFPLQNYIQATPIMVSNMDTTGTFEVAEVAIKHGIITCLHKFYSNESILAQYPSGIPDRIFLTFGISEADKEKLVSFNTMHKKRRGLGYSGNICLDVANGYMDSVPEAVKFVREVMPFSTIMVGNIATPEPIKDLAKAGADIIKVGIGSGSHCYTRIMAGVGIPQLTAVQMCVKEAKKYKVLICADGGVVDHADFAKALGAGADFVMAGSIFAAHDESGGEIVYDELDNPYKEVYGMSSETAMDKYHGGLASYRASEGRTSRVPLRGPIEKTFLDILGALRSTCTYVNAAYVSELPKKVKFIRVNNTLSRAYEKYTTGK